MISFEGVNQFCVRRLLWILTSEHKLNIVMIKLGVTSPVSVGSYSVLVLSHILHVLHNPDITACCCPPTDPCSHQPPVTDCMTRRDSRDSVTRDSPRHITAMLPSVLQTVCLTECGDVSSARCGHCTAQPGPAAVLLLLYAIKQVLDTNTETAEPHSAQWAQSGHWPPA